MCICQNCGVGFKMDLMISDEIWEDIKPGGRAPGTGLMCPKCIITKVMERETDSSAYNYLKENNLI